MKKKNKLLTNNKAGLTLLRARISNRIPKTNNNSIRNHFLNLNNLFITSIRKKKSLKDLKQQITGGRRRRRRKIQLIIIPSKRILIDSFLK